MKHNQKKGLCLLLSSVFCFSSVLPALGAGTVSTDRITNAPKYQGSDSTEYVKISHPEKPVSSIKNDPTESEEKKQAHKSEVFADGVVDYIGNEDLGAPFADAGAEGQGDRGQTYSWAGYAYGDWMYVSTLFNSTESTGRLLGNTPDFPNLEKTYGGDLFYKEPDDLSPGPSVDPEAHEKLKKLPGSTLSKINVKTGEVQIIMSKTKNGLETSFRNAIEYNGKLYFCGSVNHLPSIYEIDPKTDAFQCVYQDPSIRNHPGGPSAAYAESLAKRICPTIRGLTTFQDYLIISTVGTDGNPYIAASKDPSKGFTKIASTWADGTDIKDENKTDAELLGYPACRIQDSIMGGSIWEMVEFNGSLYVAICTGTPENAPETHKKTDEDGNLVPDADPVLDTMQSFALIRGDLKEGAAADDRSAWTWTPVIGDLADGAQYPFGIDPERHRASACNMVIYNDHLYIGEYNDTQIAFQNMKNREFEFLARNMEESVGLYRMDKDEHIDKVMGDKTNMFPTVLSDHKKADQSGFGQRENQYIWQMREFQGKLYIGTFDETMILRPMAKIFAENIEQNKPKVTESVDAIAQTAQNALSADGAKTFSTEEALDPALMQELLDTLSLYETRKDASLFNDLLNIPESDGFVLLPSAVLDADPVVRVESPADLYLALLTLKDLMTDTAERSTTQILACVVQITKLQEEISSYLNGHRAEVPSVLLASAEPFAEDEQTDQGENHPLVRVMKLLKDSISGFDVYTMDENHTFTKVTDNGMGDPYNQGLRVFAANNSEENPWMTFGTANPFYGTQVWRMSQANIDPNVLDPAQERIKVVFTDNLTGKEIPREWDKADEIYVNEGVSEVIPMDLSIIVPHDWNLIDPETPVSIADGKLTIPLSPRMKDVSVSFVDEQDNLIGTETSVKVRWSKQFLEQNDLKDKIPNGYELAEPNARIRIEANANGENFAKVVVTPVSPEPETKDITVTYMDGETLVTEQSVAVPADAEVLDAELLVLPEGYELADPDAVLSIVDNTVIVKVQKTTAPEPETKTVTVTYMDGENLVTEQSVAVPADAEVLDAELLVLPEGYELADPDAVLSIVDNTVIVKVQKTTAPEPETKTVTVTYMDGETLVTEQSVAVSADAEVLDAELLILPEGYELADPDAVLSIVDNTVIVMVQKTTAPEPETKDITVKFMDGENLVLETQLSVPADMTVLTKNELKDNLPAGYVLVNEDADFAIVDGIVTVEVQKENEAETLYTITVKNGTANLKEAPEDAEITIKADKAPAGKVFSHWNVLAGNAELKNAKAPVTVFEMPDENVVIEAIYKNKPAGGGSHGGGGGGGAVLHSIEVVSTDDAELKADKTKAAAGRVITITADVEDDVILKGISVVTKNSKKEIPVTEKDGKFTFTMPEASVVVSANTVPAEPEEQEKIIILQIGNLNISINGKEFKNDVAPILVNDRTMVPIRVITEALGGKVTWNAETSSVTLDINGSLLSMTVGKPMADFDTPPVIFNDRTYVPLRYVAEKLGAEVKWVQDTKQIIITQKTPEKTETK